MSNLDYDHLVFAFEASYHCVLLLFFCSLIFSHSRLNIRVYLNNQLIAIATKVWQITLVRAVPVLLLLSITINLYSFPLLRMCCRNQLNEKDLYNLYIFIILYVLILFGFELPFMLLVLCLSYKSTKPLTTPSSTL